MSEDVKFSGLIGKVLADVRVSPDKDSVTFECIDGAVYQLFHEQDCCEHVTVEDVTGNLADLLHVPIRMADESCSSDRPADLPKPEYEDDSQTWTFYQLGTVKGYVTIRWYGSSNGYYSESVSFKQTEQPHA